MEDKDLTSVSQEDIDKLNKILDILIQRNVLLPKQIQHLLNISKDEAYKLKCILLNAGYVKESIQEGGIMSIQKTKEALNLNYLQNIFDKQNRQLQKENEENNKTILEIDKLKLEIKSIKRNKWITYISIGISIIALIISLWKL